MGFVRIDRVRKPLESPYEGPYEVIECTDKIAQIKLSNSMIIAVSRDRIKLAHIREPSPVKKTDSATTQLVINSLPTTKEKKHVTFKD